MRPKRTVYALRRRDPSANRAVCQDGQDANHIPGLVLLQGGHSPPSGKAFQVGGPTIPATIRPASPGRFAHPLSTTVLIVPSPSITKSGVRRTQCPLQAADHLAGDAQSDSGSPRFWHRSLRGFRGRASLTQLSKTLSPEARRSQRRLPGALCVENGCSAFP
jgi:hypothetical protein